MRFVNVEHIRKNFLRFRVFLLAGVVAVVHLPDLGAAQERAVRVELPCERGERLAAVFNRVARVADHIDERRLRVVRLDRRGVFEPNFEEFGRREELAR